MTRKYNYGQRESRTGGGGLFALSDIHTRSNWNQRGGLIMYNAHNFTKPSGKIQNQSFVRRVS